MMNMDDEQHNKRPHLRLIHGGASDSKLDAAPTWRSAPESQTPQTAQADRLRNAILRCVVEEFGQTVDEVLREICEKFDSVECEDYCRLLLLRNNLDQSGLRFMAAREEMELNCEGYLLLFNAKCLLAQYPELSTLRPEDHALLTIGELPPSQRSETWLSRHVAEPAALRNLKRELGKPKLDGPGYFDVSEISPWAQESNRLRRAILALPLDSVDSSVREAMIELCNSLDARTNKQRDRVDDLKRSLESVGLSFVDATESCELAITGYLTLSWPKRLLSRHPNLGFLHPVSWHSMPIA